MAEPRTDRAPPLHVRLVIRGRTLRSAACFLAAPPDQRRIRGDGDGKPEHQRERHRHAQRARRAGDRLEANAEHGAQPVADRRRQSERDRVEPVE
jgi:hypothetical protein